MLPKLYSFHNRVSFNTKTAQKFLAVLHNTVETNGETVGGHLLSEWSISVNGLCQMRFGFWYGKIIDTR